MTLAMPLHPSNVDRSLEPPVPVWGPCLSCHSPHSNRVEIPTERGRTLFDLVPKTSESARACHADLSRRLRDGVSLWETNWLHLQRSVVQQIRIRPGSPPPKIAPEKRVRHSRENIDNTPRPRSWPMAT